jgi:hypothetical protein
MTFGCLLVIIHINNQIILYKVNGVLIITLMWDPSIKLSFIISFYTNAHNNFHRNLQQPIPLALQWFISITKTHIFSFRISISFHF